MYQSLVQDSRLPAQLIRIDEDLLAREQARRCGVCGGVLHRADYPRKPRGPWRLGREYQRRLSLCCAEEGCRRRTTPPSVLFVGRKVYLGAVVVLVTALRYGPTPARLAKIREVWGVGVRTLARWRKWWTGAFGRSPFWRAARARFATPIREDQLPCSLIEAFGVSERDERLVDLLRWLSPVSSREGPCAQAV